MATSKKTKPTTQEKPVVDAPTIFDESLQQFDFSIMEKAGPGKYRVMSEKIYCKLSKDGKTEQGYLNLNKETFNQYLPENWEKVRIAFSSHEPNAIHLVLNPANKNVPTRSFSNTKSSHRITANTLASPLLEHLIGKKLINGKENEALVKMEFVSKSGEQVVFRITEYKE